MEIEKKKNKKMRKKKTMYITLEDSVFVFDEDYITESKNFRFLYRCGYHGNLPVSIKGISSRIIRKALQFSEQRGQIKSQHNKNDEDDNLLLQQNLQAFDQNFLQKNLADAFDLADVACRFQMKSLFYLTRKAAAETITQKTPDEIRKMLDLYYDDDKTDARSFERMKYEVAPVTWVFKPVM